MPDDDPPQHLIVSDEYGLSVLAKADDGWCAALDRETFRCTIYARRPQVCRDFREGGSECRSERAEWRQLARLNNATATG